MQNTEIFSAVKNESFIGGMIFLHKKVQIDNDQEKSQSERNPYYKNRGGKNQIDNQVPTLKKENIVSSYFTTGGHSVTRT